MSCTDAKTKVKLKGDLGSVEIEKSETPYDKYNYPETTKQIIEQAILAYKALKN